MLNDKHIYKWFEYLVEQIPNGYEVIRNLPNEWDEVFIEMYKKGYKDCLEDNGLDIQ